MEALPAGSGPQISPVGHAAGADAAGARGTAAALAAQVQVDPNILAAALADGSEIVFGVPVDDGGISKVVRRVVILASLAATYYMCHSISDLVRGQYSSESSGNVTSLWSAVSTLTLELSIPACGYYGALHANRQLTCCFCSCNLFVAMVTVMQFIRIELRIGEINGQCEREQTGQERRTCEVWVSNGPDKYLTMVNLIVVICLGCLAFWFGNSLYQRLAGDFIGDRASAPVPLVGEVISLASMGVPGDSVRPVQPPAAASTSDSVRPVQPPAVDSAPVAASAPVATSSSDVEAPGDTQESGHAGEGAAEPPLYMEDVERL